MPRIFERIARRVGRLPAWARPAAYGGLYIGAVVALRVVGAIAAALVRAEPVPAAALLLLPMGVALGAYLGAVGGLVFGLVRPRLRRSLGRAGDVLTGLACVYAYMLALAVPGGADMLRDPAFWVISGGFGLFFGGLLAFAAPPPGA